MRVVVLTHAYPRYPGDVAGAFIARLCDALASAGHTVEVVAPADEGRGGEDGSGPVRVTRVRYAPARHETLAYRGTMADAARSLRGLRTFAGLVRALRNAAVDRVREGGVDLLHAHWWLPGGLAAWRAHRATRVPYVVTMHGTDVAVLKRSALARMLGRRVLGNAAGLSAVSSFLAREAASLTAVDPAGMTIQPMPLDTTDLPDPGEPGRARPGTVRIASVGRLTSQKRLGLLLEAVRGLAGPGQDTVCTIAGDGPERAALERRSARAGLAGRVRFLGAVEPAQVAGVLRDADVFAFPAVREGFGLAAVEALMAGVPVVACSDGGGVLDALADGGGRVVPPGDPQAFGAALIDAARDDALRGEALAAGRQWRERLSPAAAAGVYAALYTYALEGNA